jgi:hypothetical protein
MKFSSDQDLANWLQTTEATDIIVKTLPQQVNTAQFSNAHRFYWFNIHDEPGLNAAWSLGANLHFGGDIGGVWVSLKSKVTKGPDNKWLMLASFEVHPTKPTVNPVRIPMQNRLRQLTKTLENWNGAPVPAGCTNFVKGHITF